MKIAHIEWEKKPRTLGKVQKIKDLEGVGLFHPFKNTRYVLRNFQNAVMESGHNFNPNIFSFEPKAKKTFAH